MYSVVKGFVYGFSISFMGSLPPGVLNVTAVGFGASGKLSRALWFALGVTLVEVVYLRATLSLLSTVLTHPSAVLICRVVTIIFLSALAIATLHQNRPKAVKALLPTTNRRPFWQGVLMAAANPLQLVFWAGWLAILVANHVFQEGVWWYSVFSIGSGIGTLAALGVFIFAGHHLSGFFYTHARSVKTATGLVFITLALYQLTLLLL
jgi:threonine/homoserine/homoserine lactone efflux protein